MGCFFFIQKYLHIVCVQLNLFRSDFFFFWFLNRNWSQSRSFSSDYDVFECSVLCPNVTCIFHFTLWCHHHINNTFFLQVSSNACCAYDWMDDRCHCCPFQRSTACVRAEVLFSRDKFELIDAHLCEWMSEWMNE